MPEPNEVTRLLHRWREGDLEARDALMPVVYDQLRALAHRWMQNERAGHTLQATALVNEAYIRLVQMDVPFQDRVHFFALAATVARRVLVDYARTRRTQKRGGGVTPVPLDDIDIGSPETFHQMIEIDEALERLAAFDERKVRMIELVYFGGLSTDEAAAAMEISPATLFREMKVAKAWLQRELKSLREPAGA